MRLIDADALPTLATELRLKNGKTKHFVGAELDDIRNAPTIDPVRHGRWIVDGGSLYIECSECGQRYFYNEKQGFANFCNTCGAKMDGGEE